MEERLKKNEQPAKMPALVIGGTASGVGKTTFTCGLLRLLQKKGIRPCAFKCGPDYIDPTFHGHILKMPIYNLDLFLAESDIVRALYASHSADHDISIIEGIMGYYDGIRYETKASTWEIAKTLQVPAILLVSANSMGASLEAVLKGFTQMREDSHIAGVIFNGISPARYPEAEKIAKRCGIEALGYLPYDEAFSLRSRYLGLMMVRDIPAFIEKVDHIADLMEQTIDLKRILEIADVAKLPDVAESRKLLEKQIFAGRNFQGGQEERVEDGPVIGVAKDEAFCFYYEDNLDFLKACGARIAYFSPLYDTGLPEGCSALYLGGGYPELCGERLGRNLKMVESVRLAVMDGMPCIAECGGYLYLHERVEGIERIMFPMTGVIHADAACERKLKCFGYVELTADKDFLLMKKGERLRAHSFHYWQSYAEDKGMTVRKVSSGERWQEGTCSETLYGAFPHLYFRGCPEVGLKFVQTARDYQNRVGVAI